jgi:hypothetical protein
MKARLRPLISPPRPCPSPKALEAHQGCLSPAPGCHDRPAKPNPAASMSPGLRVRPARAAPAPRRAAGPAPIVFQLGLVARPCPRHGPQSLDGGPTAGPNPPRRRLADAKSLHADRGLRSAGRKDPRPQAVADYTQGGLTNEPLSYTRKLHHIDGRDPARCLLPSP